jgi:hypothetical protein
MTHHVMARNDNGQPLWLLPPQRELALVHRGRVPHRCNCRSCLPGCRNASAKFSAENTCKHLFVDETDEQVEFVF